VLRVLALSLALAATLAAWQAAAPTDNQTIQALIDRLAAAEARIKQLEERQPGAATPAPSALLPSPATPSMPANMGNATMDTPVPASPDDDPHAHMMEIPGGPALKIRGFFDYNYGMGPAANPLQFPLGGQAHNTFQAGEFDLFVTSKLSEHLDFVGEMVFGWDQTNELGVDIERYQLT
jgi:hypothetical protein